MEVSRRYCEPTTPMSLRVCDLIHKGMIFISAASETPRLDSELLLGHVLKRSRLELMTDAQARVLESQAEEFFRLVARRAESVPIAYIIGRQEFWGLEFFVSSAVLIPRPETELLVELGLKFLSGLDTVPSVLDLGTGSGCVAIALTKSFSGSVEVIALDKCPEALKVAQKNAELHRVANRISFMQADWHQGLPSAKFDLVLSNPPYVSADDLCSPSVRYEPSHALFSDQEGLKDIHLLLREVPKILNPGGAFLCEIGHKHADMVRDSFPELAQRLSFFTDLAGRERVLMLRCEDA